MKLSRITGSIKGFFRKLRDMLIPSPLAWKGAATGLLLVAAILILSAVIPYLGVLGIPVLLLQILYHAGLPALMALGVFLLLGLLNRFPGGYRKMLVASVFFIIQFFMVTQKGKLVLAFWIILSASLLAGSAAVLIAAGKRKLKGKGRILLIVSFLLGSAGMGYGAFWFFRSGKAIDKPVNAALQATSLPGLILADDPSAYGPYEVLTLTYGSGTDRRRTEYADSVVLTTPAVDGRPFVDNWKKFSGWAREKFWGFDLSALPLNARVWYPSGEGPFPLVLVVHGNHLDRDYSDPGYDYLGELMASRGFIFASVDENFLNGAWSDVFGRLKEENDARAWLLLKHLECWEKWSKEDSCPFQGKVDMERISLIGHSRGGEAVCIAAFFNRLPCYPDDAMVSFDFGFNILSVIPIAPVDGQYKPGETGTSIENTSYFTLQGSHDMDMRSYHGARQYQRVNFTDSLYHVKAGLYIYGANHGQFNTTWGRNDAGYPGFFLFNRKNILPAGDQEKIAKVYISAFLELTLHDRTEYLPLFRDFRTGRHWLPETLYLNQFEDSNTSLFCSFEEDLDLTSTTAGKGCISAENLSVWREQLVPLKWGPQDTRAVYLGWNREEDDSLYAAYHIRADGFPCDPVGSLVFSLADASENSRPDRDWLQTGTTAGESEKEGEPRGTLPDSSGVKTGKTGKRKDKAKKDGEKEPLDFTVVLTDKQGNRAALAMNDYLLLQPQPEARVMKWQLLTDVALSEIVFQYYSLPFEWFIKANPSFRPDELKGISLVFDRSPEGVIVLDNLGFAERMQND